MNPVDHKAGREGRAQHLGGAQAPKPADQCAENRAEHGRTRAAHDDQWRNQQSRHKTTNSVVIHGETHNVFLRCVGFAYAL